MFNAPSLQWIQGFSCSGNDNAAPVELCRSKGGAHGNVGAVRTESAGACVANKARALYLRRRALLRRSEGVEVFGRLECVRVIRPAEVFVDIGPSKQSFEGSSYGPTQLILPVNSLCVVDDASDVSIIEGHIRQVLSDQDGRNAQGVADAQLIVDIRIATCDIGNHSTRLPDLVPDI